MTDYVWYPVSGDGQSPLTPYTWANGPFNWNTGSWIVGDALIFGAPTIVAGAVPGSGSGNSQGPGLDSVGLVAGEIKAADVAFYNAFIANPSKGNPYIGSNLFQVDLVINSGTVDIGSLLLAGFNADADLPQFPTVEVTGATFRLEGSVSDTFTASFPNFGTQTVTGGGTIEVGGNGTVAIAGTVLPAIVVDFVDASPDLLSLGAVSSGQTTAFAGTIAGFGAGDTIDLPTVAFTAGMFENFDTATSTLTISNAGGTQMASLHMAGAYTTASFQLQNDGSSGTAIVTCFAAGTRIRTQRGEVAVESLCVGDRVPTQVKGNAATVRWIGHRHVDCGRHVRPELVWPVRIAAGALGSGMPARDLYLSPDHAVFVDGVLIPVKYLIDGDAIRQCHWDSVTYYHVELEQHDVLLAEGVPVESYLDSGDRRAFDNGGSVVEAYPDFSSRVWEAAACARIVVTGPEVAAVRQRIRRRIAAAA